MSDLQGITRQDEEKNLKRVLSIAEQKLQGTRQNVKELADELHAMLEEFDEEDKEMQTLWNNTDARFKEVNQELRRAEQARKKPYFGRIDFQDKHIGKEETYYIGRSVIAENPAKPDVIDWRAPIASVYYDSSLGDVTYSVKGEGKYEICLSRKRTYEIEKDALKDFYDSDVVANDELLTKYLAKTKRNVLGEIIATIQQEQNEVIRKKPQHNLIIQGAAGSGKTTVAMHRISYILYNYELEFDPKDFYIIGSNQVLLNYITGVLPELDVYGVSQMTMEQLFVRLLYEDWDEKYSVVPIQKGITPPVKGTFAWFHDLEDFCERYERKIIPMDTVRIERNGALLMTGESIEKVYRNNLHLSRADKLTILTEHLIAKLENEISGKYYSYSLDEKKKLTNYYTTYFGKREWKGPSIFELYASFLTEQERKGFPVRIPKTEFDVYDLAALAYLYKRIKETEIIREAGHLVIDEAQDFGMMVYGSLKYCLSKCTYTIMGDVAQNISHEYGLNDWTQLRELMLPGEFDYFGLLRKSYRNTVEIANFATDILYHGSFQVYPVEPIIRHGKEVRVTSCASYDELIKETEETVKRWLAEGQETIAIVCADMEEAARVSESLTGRIELLPNVVERMEFGVGVMVLSLEYTKGLEFDSVLLFDASDVRYPAQDGYVKRLYVAVTRALHELVVLHQGNLTRLIAEPVPKEKRQKAIVHAQKPKRKPMPQEPDKTKEEIYRQRATEGEEEMARRNLFGPRRIVVGQNALTGKARVSGKARNATPIQVKRPAVKEEKPSAASEFGELPDDRTLRPAGHNRIDCSVRFVMKGRNFLDIVSNYGTLRIMPMASEIVRVCFARGQCDNFPEPLAQYRGQKVNFRFQETRETVDIRTELLLVSVDKKTGATRFFNWKGKLLLSERAKEPRQIGTKQAWIYFDWGKQEKLIAKGESEGRLLEIGASARYISYGAGCDKVPALASSNGYELMFAPGSKILCCNIPMYGPYISMEGSEVADYYFKG